MFRVVAIVMNVAPLGAMGAMALHDRGVRHRVAATLAKLMACVYLTMAVFIFVGLAVICRLFRFSLWQYLEFINEEILLVLGTARPSRRCRA